MFKSIKYASQSSLSTAPSHSSSRLSFFERYLIGKTLGEGSNAVVKQLSPVPGLNTPPLALKIFKEKEHWPTAKTEGRILADLSHKNIIRLERVCKKNEKFYLVLEFFDGPNLADVLRKRKGVGLEEKTVALILSQLVEGLAHCHERGISHLDVKPENILVDSAWNLRLIDFAFSIKTPDSAKVKRYCGTPAYMAPEILKRESFYPTKADVWSLGVVAYRLMTGKPPFKGTSLSSQEKSPKRFSNASTKQE
jgi:serine/threonine protein kinase